MRKYSSCTIYALFFLLHGTVMQLSCAMVTKFKTRSEIIVAPSFVIGAVVGAAATGLVSERRSEAAATTSMEIALSMQHILMSTSLYCLYKEVDMKSTIDDLERAVSVYPSLTLLQNVQKKEVAELWKCIWPTNRLIQPHERGYTTLCKVYNTLLEHHVKSMAVYHGFVFGHICATFATLEG